MDYDSKMYLQVIIHQTLLRTIYIKNITKHTERNISPVVSGRKVPIVCIYYLSYVRTVRPFQDLTQVTVR